MSSDSISKIKPVEYEWKEDDLTMNVGFSAQEIDDLLKTSMSSYTTGAQGSSQNSYTISTGAGANGTWNSSPYVFTTNNTNIGTISGAGLHVTSDAEFDGDIKLKGKSLAEMLEKIESRLSILTPNPKKLEQYEALQKAYKHYKMLEALCEERKDEDESK